MSVGRRLSDRISVICVLALIAFHYQPLSPVPLRFLTPSPRALPFLSPTRQISFSRSFHTITTKYKIRSKVYSITTLSL